MKITAIKQQVKRAGRYSIFIDDKYGFSLSDMALLESKLAPGQELSTEQVKDLKQASIDDKLYNLTLQYVTLRPHSRWEIEVYLQRKKASPTLTNLILNKLSINNFINDEAFARSFVENRRLLRPTSRRKIINELRQKHVNEEVIQSALGEESASETAALRSIIERKRRQTKYHDDLKLMQYLARQGFSYGDIKAALQNDQPD
jgi:regulatory protein